MDKKKKNDYLVLFSGAKISKREANKVGLGLIFGIIGVVLTVVINTATGKEFKIFNYIIIVVLTLFGYFIVGNKIFKR
jgi:hypothetical protein